jgi:hypothetical protein
MSLLSADLNAPPTPSMAAAASIDLLSDGHEAVSMGSAGTLISPKHQFCLVSPVSHSRFAVHEYSAV